MTHVECITPIKSNLCDYSDAYILVKADKWFFFEKNLNISTCISSKLDINKKLTGNIKFQNLSGDVMNYAHN